MTYLHVRWDVKPYSLTIKAGTAVFRTYGQNKSQSAAFIDKLIDSAYELQVRV